MSGVIISNQQGVNKTAISNQQRCQNAPTCKFQQCSYDVKLTKVSKYATSSLGPNIHWSSNYGTGIVFIGNMLSWLSFHNFV